MPITSKSVYFNNKKKTVNFEESKSDKNLAPGLRQSLFVSKNVQPASVRPVAFWSEGEPSVGLFILLVTKTPTPPPFASRSQTNAALPSTKLPLSQVTNRQTFL